MADIAARATTDDRRMDGAGSATTGLAAKGHPTMSAAIKRRVLALESAKPPGDKPRQLPTIVEDDISDADLDALRRRTGREIYRMKDHPIWDCFIG